MLSGGRSWWHLSSRTRSHQMLIYSYLRPRDKQLGGGQ